jgi:hypothetical protein
MGKIIRPASSIEVAGSPLYIAPGLTATVPLEAYGVNSVVSGLLAKKCRRTLFVGFE